MHCKVLSKRSSSIAVYKFIILGFFVLSYFSKASKHSGIIFQVQQEDQVVRCNFIIHTCHHNVIMLSSSYYVIIITNLLPYYLHLSSTSFFCNTKSVKYGTSFWPLMFKSLEARYWFCLELQSGIKIYHNYYECLRLW